MSTKPDPASHDLASSGTHDTPPITVFSPGDEKLAEEVLQKLAPQSGAWSRRSTSAMEQAVIMMVDDESLNIEMTEAFLTEAGYQNFVHTTDSRRALPMMRERQPSVLLLDLSMPHIGGLEILDAMRQDPDLRHLPVIVLTSTTDPAVKLQALSQGAMDFLSKPVDPSELALRIRNTLGATAYRDFLAHHDALTGLPNQLRYRSALAEVLQVARTAGHRGAVLHVGVDRLGAINDALGRGVGDQVLQRLAKRLAQCVETEVGGDLSTGGQSPMLFRFEGDAFAVLVPQAEETDLLAAFISKLVEESGFAFSRGGQDLFITCSVGIAAFPQDGRTPEEVVTNANVALSQAKESGRNTFEFFSSKMNELARSRLTAGADLRRAFGRNEIELLYWPVVELATGKLAGAEAVIQWKQPSGRVVASQELLALAATNDMFAGMSEWALEQVVGHVRRWSAAGLPLVPISVNLSLAHVRARELAEMLRKATRSGLEPKHLAIQLQQFRGVMELLPADRKALEQLRTVGFRLALDAFGSGSAGPLILRELPFDEVKLDPRFLDGITEVATANLLRGVLRMLERMGLRAIVCGVDHPLKLAFLQKLQAPYGQGPALGDALSGMDFAVKWLTRHGKPGAPGAP
ncbi:EAL domain-containing protein [Caenimonas sedimenti]|uniref:EAL domain-containing protein n=1 Tax=Caenimonas sedimenti TaxID=2596921 RepID=A0A562ZQH2_9BURK|nr:EAL domain-containing protein [Caenimonas sedimenti]TWO70637.1 EAL domain-containing protein [Caenimonas sedimenti]